MLNLGLGLAAEWRAALATGLRVLAYVAGVRREKENRREGIVHVRTRTAGKEECRETPTRLLSFFAFLSVKIVI